MKNDTFGILIRPHITEKTMVKSGEYAFVVAGTANKREVAAAVAQRFSVTVEDVRVLNMPGKERRRGRTIGWKSGFKKAVVVLAKGQTIEMQ
ncbi:MAG: 50S ribosomal protein L23 [Candidatus Sungbacteria bacterium]|nr:50S ribosomal protein L23 [Candidatus Sungbacteria bacterium]